MGKSIIVIALICLILMSGIAIAEMVPQPIAVKLNSQQSVVGLDVEIRNIRLGLTKVFKTNEYGEIMTDAAVFEKSKESDIYQATVLACKDEPVCVQSAIFDVSIFFNFDLTGIDLPEPTCPVCPTCPDIPDCPTCEECGECPDCPSCEECPICPDVTIEFIITIIISVIGGMGVMRYGFGLKIYTKRTGEVALLHKHSGIRAYHSPEIEHRKLSIRHPKGLLNPKYEGGKYIG